MTGSGISRGGGGGGPGDPATVESEELDAVLSLRFLRSGRFAKSMTAMRRRTVAIMAAAMMPPWIILGTDVMIECVV